MKKNVVLIISGPTATGKTQTSINLASELSHEHGLKTAVVNFDSLLFYRELSIGTAKPNMNERNSVEHHMIDISSITDELNASSFVELAETTIKKLHEEGKIVFLVGGSAFYLRALIKGMYESETTDEDVRARVAGIYDEEGIESVIRYLRDHDPECLEYLHENDHYRLTRAMEFNLQTGKKISEQKKKTDSEDPYDFSANRHPDWNIFHIYLDIPKEDHWKIMEERARKMVSDGLIEEVIALKDNGFSGQEKPLQSIGYKETLAWLAGEFESQEEYIERLSINTRRLAKSQRTFFKKVTPKNNYHPLSDQKRMLKDVLGFLSL